MFGAVHEFLPASGLPADLSSYGWDNVTQGAHVDFARKWAAGEERGLLLEGPVGVGKTGCAACAAIGFMALRSLRWRSALALQACLTERFGGATRDATLATLQRIDALVIDDLDKVVRGDVAMARALLLAIDTRINAGTSLLVTTNLKPSELHALFPAPWGEAIVSRIVGYCPRFVIAGQDRRRPS